MTRHSDKARFQSARPIIPRGVAHCLHSTDGPTREFAFLTLPRFTLLAFTSAVEPLRIANQLTQKPLYSWRVVSLDGEATESSAGIKVNADQGLDPVSRTTTVIVCSGTDAADAADARVLRWLRDHARHGGGLGTVCTGSFTLARAGLLHDEPTAVHWENRAAFRELFDLEPLPQMYFMGRRHFSCAGGEAAIDLMLSLIDEHHGTQLADAVAEMCLHSRRREPTLPQKQAFPSQMQSRHPAVSRVIAAMEENIDTPLDREQLAQVFGHSCRHLERTFKAVTGESPSRIYLGLRLEKARNLLSDTRMSILDVAIACGFNDRNTFSKAFTRRFGVSPQKYR